VDLIDLEQKKAQRFAMK